MDSAAGIAATIWIATTLLTIVAVVAIVALVMGAAARSEFASPVVVDGAEAPHFGTGREAADVSSQPSSWGQTLNPATLSLALYVAACATPALGPGHRPVWGIGCLIIPLLWFPGLLMFYWWANPAYFVALYYWRRRQFRLAVLFGWAAALLATPFFLVMGAQFIREASSWPDAWRRMSDFKLGSWLWLASLWVFAIHAWRETRATRLPRQHADVPDRAGQIPSDKPAGIA